MLRFVEGAHKSHTRFLYMLNVPGAVIALIKDQNQPLRFSSRLLVSLYKPACSRRENRSIVNVTRVNGPFAFMVLTSYIHYPEM